MSEDAAPHQDVRLRLSLVLAAVASKLPSVQVVQAWMPARTAAGASAGVGPHKQEFVLRSDTMVAVLGDPRWTSFRLLSISNPVAVPGSITGRVFRSGSLQVVQDMRQVPPNMHPRTFLTEADLNCLGEALYLPVYDVLRPGAGPITVLEALLPAHSPEPLVAADLISFISAGLAAMHLSVSNPLPPPITRPALSGRRFWASADDGSPGEVAARGVGEQQQQQQPMGSSPPAHGEAAAGITPAAPPVSSQPTMAVLAPQPPAQEGQPQGIQKRAPPPNEDAAPTTSSSVGAAAVAASSQAQQQLRCLPLATPQPAMAAQHGGHGAGMNGDTGAAYATYLMSYLLNYIGLVAAAVGPSPSATVAMACAQPPAALVASTSSPAAAAATAARTGTTSSCCSASQAGGQAVSSASVSLAHTHTRCNHPSVAAPPPPLQPRQHTHSTASHPPALRGTGAAASVLPAASRPSPCASLCTGALPWPPAAAASCLVAAADNPLLSWGGPLSSTRADGAAGRRGLAHSGRGGGGGAAVPSGSPADSGALGSSTEERWAEQVEEGSGDDDRVGQQGLRGLQPRPKRRRLAGGATAPSPLGAAPSGLGAHSHSSAGLLVVEEHSQDEEQAEELGEEEEDVGGCVQVVACLSHIIAPAEPPARPSGGAAAQGLAQGVVERGRAWPRLVDPVTQEEGHVVPGCVRGGGNLLEEAVPQLRPRGLVRNTSFYQHSQGWRAPHPE